jgi:hypothetical protein
LFILLVLRGLVLLVLLVLLFLGLQHALEDLLELAESIGSCLRQAVSGCDRKLEWWGVDLRTPGMMDGRY